MSTQYVIATKSLEQEFAEWKQSMFPKGLETDKEIMLKTAFASGAVVGIKSAAHIARGAMDSSFTEAVKFAQNSCPKPPQAAPARFSKN